MDKKYGFLSSSEDPQKLGDTVKGIILGAGVFLIAVARYYGFEITSLQITDLAIGAGSAVSAVWVAYGLVKKLVIGFRDTFHK